MKYFIDIVNVILTTTPWSRSYDPHFTGEETEVLSSDSFA